METFIVRVMHGDHSAADDAGLRGVIRRVTDGWETTFSDGDELLVFLRTPTTGGGPGNWEETE